MRVQTWINLKCMLCTRTCVSMYAMAEMHAPENLKMGALVNWKVGQQIGYNSGFAKYQFDTWSSSSLHCHNIFEDMY